MQNQNIIDLRDRALYHPVKFQIDIPNRMKMAFERNFGLVTLKI